MAQVKRTRHKRIIVTISEAVRLASVRRQKACASYSFDSHWTQFELSFYGFKLFRFTIQVYRAVPFEYITKSKNPFNFSFLLFLSPDFSRWNERISERRCWNSKNSFLLPRISLGSAAKNYTKLYFPNDSLDFEYYFEYFRENSFWAFFPSLSTFERIFTVFFF